MTYAPARPVNFGTNRWAPCYRAPLGAVDALFTARSSILADRVVSVRFEYPSSRTGTPASLVLERVLDEDETWIEFPRTPSTEIIFMLEWSLNREAALQDARRINALACRMSRMGTAERWIYYEDMAALWQAFRVALYRAWDTSYCECRSLHPAGDWVNPCPRWARLDMSSLISGMAARFIYEAVAAEHGLALPEGDFDESYGRNNLAYLDRAMEEAEDLSGWVYRLYVCFSGPSPDGVEPVWHCVPSYRFGPSEPDPASRFDDEDNPLVPVRGHAVRLA